MAGVLGAYFVLFPSSRVLVLVPFPPLVVEVPAVVFLGIWILWQLAITFGRAEVWARYRRLSDGGWRSAW